MIFYFSATGNSKYITSEISDAQQGKAIDITTCFKKNQFKFSLKENEKIGFVFPVYFFGLPTILISFIEKLKLENYHANYMFAICTCGTFSSNTLYNFRKLLKKRDFRLNAGFTIKQPDNYILLFNLLLPEEKRNKIIERSKTDIKDTNQRISKQETGINKKNMGPLPSVISILGYPLYSRGRSTRPFYATGNCTGCNLCSNICPVSMISMHNNKPEWKKGKCTQCLACLHNCPTKAIQYGKATLNRGRYHNPMNKKRQ